MSESEDDIFALPKRDDAVTHRVYQSKRKSAELGASQTVPSSSVPGTASAALTDARGKRILVKHIFNFVHISSSSLQHKSKEKRTSNDIIAVNSREGFMIVTKIESVSIFFT